jgi:hypothetical protein
MNDPFANNGFKMLTGTSAIDLSGDPLQGFTPSSGDAEIAAITFPTTRGGKAFQGDSGIVGETLLEGVFYPVPCTGITLTSGKLIGWRD